MERQTKPSRPYEIVCSDIKGPFLVPSKEGFRYYISFNCLYSTWTQIKLLRTKAAEEVLEATKWFITNAQAETKQRLTTFLTDNGTEYVNRQLSTYLIQKNIKHLRTIPYSPQQNGQAERKNQTIMAITRCILIESRLPYNYWSFAVHHAVYTMNRLPTKRIEWQTPYELWQGNKPDVHHLRPFGCIAYAHLESSLRTSLQPTARKCIFLGYAPNQKGYIVQDIQNQVILARRDVTFNEQEMNSSILQEAITDANTDPVGIIDDLCDLQTYHTAEEYPRTYQESQSRPDAAHWHKAALEELQAHQDNNTWTLIKPKSHQKPIKTRWVFTKKRRANGE